MDSDALLIVQVLISKTYVSFIDNKWGPAVAGWEAGNLDAIMSR